MIYPLAVADISAVFAAAVLWQYLRRRRHYQLIWAIALLMSALASEAYVLALPPNGSQAAFRIYYVLGAVLMPAWLGLGSIALVAPKRAAEWCQSALIAVSAIGVGAVAAADLDAAALAHLDGGPGAGVLLPGPWLALTITLNTLGVVAVVGVAAYSAVRVVQRKGSGLILGANVLIAAGDLVIGVAGSMARTGHPELFWVTMFAGWIVIFAGFLLISASSLPGSVRRSPAQLALQDGRTPVA